MNEKTLLFLGARRWKFADDNGELREGVTAHIVDLDQDNDSDTSGLIPSKTTLPLDKFSSFKEGTGIYKATIELDLTSRQPRIKFGDFKLVESIDLKKFTAVKS